MTGLYTAADLQAHSLEQLFALYRKIELELLLSRPGTSKRRNALASLENISRAICRRRIQYGTRPTMAPKGPGF